MVLVPCPEIFAPIFIKKFAKSITSGSIAAFFMRVFPLASVDAIRIFSVPVTVVFGNSIQVPCNLLHLAEI